MTKERGEEVLIVALVCSVAIHVGLMLMVKSHIMTRPPVGAKPAERTVPMRVSRTAPRPDPVKIEEIMDLKAAKDAPAARPDLSVPQAALPSAPKSAVELPEPELPQEATPVTPQAVFDAKPVGLEKPVAPVAPIPMTKIETPKVEAAALSAPDFSIRVPAVVKEVKPPVSVAVPGVDSKSVFLPAQVAKSDEDGEEKDDTARAAYTPAAEIYEKVDERIVAEEKAAVRELVDAADAADLVKFVNLTMTSAVSGQWRYFKVMMTPRASLKTVPKDVVVIIDGSGSIGNDRLGSCRSAARRILRTCTNTGDRFNLVVFRNAYSYAFRRWQPCEGPSFEAADKWLARQTAHGRTDVFDTISSVLTLPRDPKRPLIALVVTDGDANAGVSDTAEILSKFTALNDGLVSVYMYGVKSSANRELIDVLTHGNRGESFIFDGWRWSAGSGMEGLSERFRDPVLADLRVIFASGVQAEAYPRLLRNLYRGGTLEFYGRVPAAAKDVAFSLKGLAGADAYEGFFRLPFATAPNDPAVVAAWQSEAAIDRKLGKR